MNIVITGGAGFIGVNAADYFLQKGHQVTIFDNYSRKGGDLNIAWLKAKIKGQSVAFQALKGDVRDFRKIRNCLKRADIVLHLAAQVAVTTSVKNPREDFEINAWGTFNVLEALRKTNPKAILLYASTNKVYGKMENEVIIEKSTRYAYKNLKYGVSEFYPLDFHSPYGCSKGAADQYVRDYARIYNLKTVVFRQSCIYGPRQFGIEDQGWLAWFIIALILKKKITIFGDGKQVRDVLYVTDLIRAYEAAFHKIKTIQGQTYNIGGGRQNTLSVWFELKPILEKLFDKPIQAKRASWRPGDQQIFVSDIRKAQKDLGWKPTTTVQTGVRKLFEWVLANKKLFVD